MGPANLFFLVLATAAPLLFTVKGLGYYSTVKPPRIWINDNVVFQNISLSIVVHYSDLELDIGAGFCCVSSISPCEEFIFAVFIDSIETQQIVWSANRDRPVKENDTLEFTTDGNLVLCDADGSHVWSSNSAGRSVAGMMITEIGNLMLFDHKKATVWQSFDHPTDTLILGQSLVEGMRLTSNTSCCTIKAENPALLDVELHGGLFFTRLASVSREHQTLLLQPLLLLRSELATGEKRGARASLNKLDAWIQQIQSSRPMFISWPSPRTMNGGGGALRPAPAAPTSYPSSLAAPSPGGKNSAAVSVVGGGWPPAQEEEFLFQ